MYVYRIVQYSTDEEIRDYFRWRQVDSCVFSSPPQFSRKILMMTGVYPAHINNMYNTCFWSLVLEGKMTAQEATTELQVAFLISLSLSLFQARLTWERDDE